MIPYNPLLPRHHHLPLRPWRQRPQGRHLLHGPHCKFQNFKLNDFEHHCAGTTTCPPGPGASAPKAGTYSTVPTATAGEVKVLWTTPQDASPQAPARTGYVVSARAKSAAAPSKFVSAPPWTWPLLCLLCALQCFHVSIRFASGIAYAWHVGTVAARRSCTWRPCAKALCIHTPAVLTTPFTAQTEVGQYIADAAATSTVLTLAAGSSVADYTIRVRSEVTGDNLSTPFPLSTVSFLLQPVTGGSIASGD